MNALPAIYALMMAGNLQLENLDISSVVISDCALRLGYEAAVKERQMEAIQAFVSGRDTLYLFSHTWIWKMKWEGSTSTLHL